MPLHRDSNGAPHHPTPPLYGAMIKDEFKPYDMAAEELFHP